MTETEKKAYMLLKSIIFHYHGLDEDEIQNLNETADELDAHEELEWASEFISEDHMTSFDRAREYLSGVVGDMPKDKRTKYIHLVWKANLIKGYITEMEATAMLQLAHDWNVHEELLKLVRSEN
ncbi:MAG: hypothetical protein OEX22_09905 [Cyclobacteriaceae bacterium]|nr:hypothetical protein [Cyclobacteriaceae bacterium]